MHRRLFAAATTLALGIAVPAFAADTNIAEVVGNTVRGEGFHDIETSATEPGAETVDAFIQVHTGPGEAFMQADSSAHIGFFPHQVAFGQVVTNLDADIAGGAHGAGLTDSIYRDTVTLNGTAAQAGQLVTLHNVMTLTNDNNEDRLDLTPASGDHATVDTTAQLQILGTGIGPGTYGGNTFGGFSHHYSDSTTFTGTDEVAPTTVDFAMTFTLGQASDLQIRQILETTDLVFDQNGAENPISNMHVGYDLSWGANFFVTLDDAQGNDTGVRLNGITSSSSSGFQYLAAAQPVAAPEPAGWALMIVGFAGAGAGLRSRRRLQDA